jgi:lipopolysaccharide transport system ATP-binding protein
MAIDIQIHQLSKKYQIGEQSSYKTLRDTISHALRRSVVRKKPATDTSSKQSVWALRNINLEIKKGDFVGLIGRNGAGKTTLLKILARITEPTEGYVQIRGKTSSLLEVGTGFHQELTGRENIYLNGSILGMKREEINKRFDAIVDFSGVSKFIDSPVKHYSSGMRVRLAFSVSAHLQPDILFIDEVLAVGDHEFQEKCMAKMRAVTGEGRTVLLVSHNLATIKEMCQTCVVLDHGEVKYTGPVAEGLALYCMSFKDENHQISRGWWNIQIGSKEDSSNVVDGDEPLSVQGYLDLEEEFVSGNFYFKIKDASGNSLVRERMSATELIRGELGPGRYRIGVELPALWLSPGVYIVVFWFSGRTKQGEDKVLSSPFNVLNVSGIFRGLEHIRTMLRPPVEWMADCKSLSTKSAAVPINKS